MRRSHSSWAAQPLYESPHAAFPLALNLAPAFKALQDSVGISSVPQQQRVRRLGELDRPGLARALHARRRVDRVSKQAVPLQCASAHGRTTSVGSWSSPTPHAFELGAQSIAAIPHAVPGALLNLTPHAFKLLFPAPVYPGGPAIPQIPPSPLPLSKAHLPETPDNARHDPPGVDADADTYMALSIGRHDLSALLDQVPGEEDHGLGVVGVIVE